MTSSTTPNRLAHGWALVTEHISGSVLDAWFPTPALGEADEETRAGEPTALTALAGPEETRQVTKRVVFVSIDLDAAPGDAIDGYLRLHLLSHRLVQPNTLNLDGLFGVLTNVVWTSAGPCAIDGFEYTRARIREERGHCTVFGVDKFPRMIDYVVPSGVRIGDADRVRLGAHLAEGTVVMHEGFVNFNAGTLGASMVEGRISQGVVVGDGSDIGGGASIMGTLSGGGKEKIRIGERCLLGANAGVGISLGDDCTVEAGLYVTAGAKVTVGDQVVRANELSGQDGLLFLRNSVTGAVEARSQRSGVELNADLH